MPNLDNLRKQAKQYQRWHRERYHPVAAEIRATLPRFRHLSDAQVLETSFKLRDAQELIARQLGFESWQALKAFEQPGADPHAGWGGRSAITYDRPCRFYSMTRVLTVAFGGRLSANRMQSTTSRLVREPLSCLGSFQAGSRGETFLKSPG